MLEVFPTSGRHWLSYANTFVAENKKPQAIAVLQRALQHCPHVDLWRAFLIHYVQITKDPADIGKAYERAVECIGQDIASNAVWNDYINFLKTKKVTSQYEKTQDMFTLRRAFHRALLVPMHQMERLWSEYEEWEKAVDPNNPHAAEQLLREMEPKHKAARAAFKDRKKLRDSIAQAERASTVLSALPGPCTGDRKEKAVLDAWLALINFEKTNPQKMAAEDLRRRMGFTLKQALSYLPFYAEVWYQAANWHAEIGDNDGEIKTLKRALAMSGDSVVLHLALAEKHEMAGNTEAAKQCYETMCEQLPGPLVYIHYMRFARRCEGVQESRAIFKRARKDPQGNTWELFADAALREYIGNKDPLVARNIFDMGLKQFSHEIQYIDKYLDFLSSTNDDNNTRVVFEKVLADDNGLASDALLRVWNKFVAFEYSRGNLSAMHKVEKRRAAAFPDLFDSSSLAQLARRTRFDHLWPCTKAELVLLGLDNDAAEVCGPAGSGHKKSAGGGGGADRGKEERRARSPSPKRASVPLPPMARALQELVDALPSGPLPSGLLGPNADEMVTHAPTCTRLHRMRARLPSCLQAARPSSCARAHTNGSDMLRCTQVNSLIQMMIPPRFYKPPSTMSVGASNLIPGSGASNHGGGGGRRDGGGKRNRKGDDESGGNDLFRQRQKQRFANITGE